MRYISAFFLLSICLVEAVRKLQVVSPLQSLTIPDPEVKEVQTSARKRFLDRFRVGVEAEAEARKEVVSAETQSLQADATRSDWADAASSEMRGMLNEKEAYIESKFDAAVGAFDEQNPLPLPRKNSNKYQFVGVVNPASKSSPISWYAREKPEGATWSVRLVHRNKEAIVKDLFNRGKVDIFAKYENQGSEEGDLKPKVTSKYSVRKRSWRNLWNFSAKNFITDSSGMYWRERRLQPGMYTDGETVYEATYRYRDGRNGMHQRSTLNQFLSSKSIDDKEKEKILKKLASDAPDVVLED